MLRQLRRSCLLAATGLAALASTWSPAQPAADRAPALPPLAVESLGAPVTTMESVAFTVYPRQGNPQHIVFFHPMRNPIECQARIIDLATGEVIEASGPPDRPLRMAEHDGKFYFGQYGRCGLWVFAPETKKMEYKEGPDLGRCVVFQLGVGRNGRLYLGTTSGCEIVEYDPKADTFRNFGRQGPKIEGPRYVYSMALEGDYVYSAAGKNPWFLVALNIRTGEQKVLPLGEPKYLSVSGNGSFATASVTNPDPDGKDQTRTYLLKNGEMFESAAYAADARGSAFILAPDRSQIIVFAESARKTLSLADLPAEDRAFTKAAGGPAGKAAFAAKGALFLVDLKTGAPLFVPLTARQTEVSAMAWTDDGILLFATQGSNALMALDPATQKPRAIATLHESKVLEVKTIVTEGDFAYVGTANPPTTVIVDLRAGKVTATKGDGRLARIHGKLFTGEAGVQMPLGKSVAVPARIRLEGGEAIPDVRYASYDLWHNHWLEPEVILDSVQLDGGLTVNYRMPGSQEWRTAQTRIKALPVKIEAIHVLPDGKVFGTTRRYQETFSFDPKGGQFQLFGKFHLSGSRAATVGGIVYLIGYPGIRVMAYDPSKAWTFGMARPGQPVPPEESPDSNPRYLCNADAADGRMPAHFPVALDVAADGCVYIGAHCERGQVGGALGWLDPKTGRLDAVPRDPFLVLDCAGLAAADEGRKIIYSSHIVTDPAGKTPAPKEAKLFVLDVPTRRIVADYVPFPDARSTGFILARGQRVYGFLRDSLYLFDLKAGQVEKKVPLTDAPYGPIWGPDGRIYLFIGDGFTRLDPATLALTPLGGVESVGPMVFNGKDLYLAGRPDLRRVRNVIQ